MDASGISLAGVTLKTPFSRIEANISAGEGILALAPDSPLKADLMADVNTKDLKYLYPALIPPCSTDVSSAWRSPQRGRWATSEKPGWTSPRPDTSHSRRTGRRETCSTPAAMEASARFEGDFRDMAFLEALLPDSPCGGA